MKIYVVGSTKNNFFKLDNIREKFLIDEIHEGDNIDKLNPWYCELTGLYYLWKHCTDDIVGLEHYRRSFPLNEQHILSILSNHDAITHTTKVRKTMVPHLATSFAVGNLVPLLKEIMFMIKMKYPEYMPTVFKVLALNEHFQCNMVITKKKILDAYCSWLFDILEEYNKYFDINKSISRGIGYIAELFLFAVWFKHNNIKTKEVQFNVFKW